MTDDIFEAERLAAALEGATVTDAQTRALASMARELSGALQGPHLGGGDRARIYGHTMRLATGGGIDVRVRRSWQRLHVSRRTVVGGVAAASLAAAIGYAVAHERRQRAAA